MQSSPSPEHGPAGAVGHDQAAAPVRRRGRRARQLTPEEIAEQERRAREAGIDTAEPHGGAPESETPDHPTSDQEVPEQGTPDGTAPAEVSEAGVHESEHPGEQAEDAETVIRPAGSTAASDGEEDPWISPAEQGGAAQSPGTAQRPVTEGTDHAPKRPEPMAAASEPASPALPSQREATPTVRRLGRRARVIELEDAPTGLDPARRSTGERRPEEIRSADRDADGVQLGELAVTEAPDPRPAPRFEGRVLHRPDRSAGNPAVWFVWIAVALAVALLIVLLLTGVIGPGMTGALPDSPAPGVVAAAHPSALISHLEVDPA